MRSQYLLSTCLVLVLIVTIGFSLEGRCQINNENSSSTEIDLTPDLDNIYHVLVSDNQSIESLSNIPSDIPIQVHNSDEIRMSLDEMRKAGDYEILDEVIVSDKPSFYRSSPLHKEINDNLESNSSSSIFSSTRAVSDCDFEQAGTSLKNNSTARPVNITDEIQVHINPIFQNAPSTPYNYVVYTNWGTTVAVESFVRYSGWGGDPTFWIWDWNCREFQPDICQTSVSNSTIMNGYVTNQWDGQKYLPVIYTSTIEVYNPGPNPSNPYRVEVWMYRFSNSTWNLVYQNRHAQRNLIPNNNNYTLAFWVEYWYGNGGAGPFCNGSTHPEIGFLNYWHCRKPVGGSCTWTRPYSNNSIWTKNPSDLPITLQWILPNYTWRVTKP